MLVTLLLAALPVTSTVSSEVHASLDAQHTHIRLVDDETLPSFDSLSREDLQRESRRLQAEKPGLIMPLVLIVAGVLVANIVTYVFSVAADDSVAWLAVLGGGYVVALVLVIIGVIVLINHLRARTAIDIQLDEIKARIETPPGQPVYPGPAPDENAPPPPPPPPPAAQNLGINSVRTIALLRF